MWPCGRFQAKIRPGPVGRAQGRVARKFAASGAGNETDCPVVVGDRQACDDQHHENPVGKLLRIVGLLPRCSDTWKTEYKKRTTIEQHFRSVKHSRLMDQHRYIGIDRVSLHVLLSMPAYPTTALAHLQADDYATCGTCGIKLPQVRREKARPMPGRSCRDPDCACCARWREAA